MTRHFKSTKTDFSNLLNLVTRKFKLHLALVLMSASLLSAQYTLGASGEEIYKKMCMSCHSTTEKVLMGPGLQGLSERRENDWIIKWVKDPQGMVNSGDEYAVKLFNDFNKVPMPGFPQLTDEEIIDFVAYVDSQKQAGGDATAAAGGAAATPDSGTTGTTQPISVDTQLVWWVVIALAIVGFFLYRFKRKTFKAVNEAGYFKEPHSIPNYAFYLVIFILCALVISYVLVAMLQNNTGMIDTLMFIALPYLAFGIFIVGSIYRYTRRGYQVSSLSSQFLEGKKLFWGSQPFHWGLLVLFFGHLIAFLFPRAVLAWNGEPVRLIILEFSSFAFGLSALLGLILLIKRRLSSKTLLVVANKMDMVVYTVLLTQIISGLGVAFFVRWGSSWFSSVLTPYLRSVFSFNPDIAAVSEMPWLIQLHIISAFAIIAIIPFTRFMHFLVAPIDYAWRKYQVVVWNWNPRNIRVSTKHTFGKKSRNH